MVNGIVSLISFLDVSLLVYRNARDFCVLILYPAILTNSLMSSNSILVASYDFLCVVSCHLQRVIVLLILFQFGFLLFLFLLWMPWLELPKLYWIKVPRVGLPWWRSGWESACQCRGHGFEPWSGRIPHATEQLGPWATITEPARLEPVLHNKRGCDSVRPAHRDEWLLLATTRESPRTETKTQHSQK